MIGLLTVAVSIKNHKELKAHPSPLIATICIFEAILTYNALIYLLTPKYIVCYLSLWRPFSISAGITPYEAFKTLIIANDLINNWAQLISLFLNIALCWDLILTLKSPFDVTRGRLRYYVTGSMLLSTIAVIYIYFRQDRE
jgi:hypothetical protein